MAIGLLLVLLAGAVSAHYYHMGGYPKEFAHRVYDHHGYDSGYPAYNGYYSYGHAHYYGNTYRGNYYTYGVYYPGYDRVYSTGWRWCGRYWCS